VSAANEKMTSALHRLGTRSAQSLTAVLQDIRCLYFIFRHPATRWYARALLFFPLAYLCSPIQLIPNFIPVLGQMDDLFVIWLSGKLVRRLVDPIVLSDCRARAAAVSFAIKFSGKSFYTWHAEPSTSDAGGSAEGGAGAASPNAAAGTPASTDLSSSPR
jgi:uncharacterized membrane protein YkvA (DUF1232 family)